MKWKIRILYLPWFPNISFFLSRLSMAPHDRVGEAAYGPLKHKIREEKSFFPRSILIQSPRKSLQKVHRRKKEKKFCFDSDLPSNLAPFSLGVENNHFSLLLLLLSLKMPKERPSFSLPCPVFLLYFPVGKGGEGRYCVTPWQNIRTYAPLSFPPVFSFDYLCVRSESEK